MLHKYDEWVWCYDFPYYASTGDTVLIVMDDPDDNMIED